MEKPRLVATFRTGTNGSLRTSSMGKYTHYKIQLSLHDLPEGVQTVTYLLHPSFKSDRVLTIPYGVPDFKEDIMTYGDFFITATVEGERPQTREWFAEAFATRVSDALKMGHPASGRSNEVQQAINQIEKL